MHLVLRESIKLLKKLYLKVLGPYTPTAASDPAFSLKLESRRYQVILSFRLLKSMVEKFKLHPMLAAVFLFLPNLMRREYSSLFFYLLRSTFHRSWPK